MVAAGAAMATGGAVGRGAEADRAARDESADVARLLEEKRLWITEQRMRQVPRLRLDPYAISESEARTAARELVSTLAAEQGERIGVEYRRIRIGGQRTLWGSCSPLGTLSFNWRLALAPLEVLDYVVCMSSATCVFQTTRDGSGRSSSDIVRSGASSAIGCVTSDPNSWHSARRTDPEARLRECAGMSLEVRIIASRRLL